MLTSRLIWAQEALALALKAGAVAADLVQVQRHTLVLRWRAGRVVGEHCSVVEESVLRAWRKAGCGTAAGVGRHPRELVAEALAAASVAPQPYPVRPADPHSTIVMHCPMVGGVDRNLLNRLAEVCEEAITRGRAVPIQVEAKWEQILFEGVNTSGVAAGYTHEVITLTCYATTETGHALVRIRGTPNSPPDAAAVGSECSFVASLPVVQKHRIQHAGTVLLAPLAVASLMALTATALRGDWVAEGRSCLDGDLGNKVAGGGLTVVDDPMTPTSAQRWLDVEASAATPTPLLDDGRIVGHLHTLATSDAYYISTLKRGGNAFRRTITDQPYPGVTTLRISAQHLGDRPLAAFSRGVLIAKLVSIPPEAAATGSLSTQVDAYQLEGGEVAGRLRGAAVSFRLPDLLACILGKYGHATLSTATVSAVAPYLLADSSALSLILPP